MFNSLNSKVLLSIFIVIFLGALVTGLVVMFTVQYQLSQKYAVEKEASIESLSISLTDDLVSGNSTQLERTIRSALVFENVVFVHVYDDHGNIASALDESGSVPSRVEISHHTLSQNGQILGSFDIGFSDEYISSLVRRTVIALVLVVAGFLLIVGIAFYFFIRRSILTPVRTLTETANGISTGNLTARIEVDSNDELGFLARTFNRMTENLRESQESLRKSRDELEIRVEERTRGERRRADQLRAINEVGRRISSFLSLDELLPYVTASLKETFDYYNVNVFLFNEKDGSLKLSAGAGGYTDEIPTGLSIESGKGITGTVAATGEYVLAPDVSGYPDDLPADDLPETRSELAVPIKLGDELSGVLDVQSNEINAFDDIDVFTVQTIGDQLAVAIQNARYYKETREMAVITERNRMAREIHDTLAQGFTGIIMQLEAAEQTLESNTESSQKHLETARNLARQSLNEARRSVWALRPQVLEEQNLYDALRETVGGFSRDSGVQADLQLDDIEGYISPDTENALLRISQEALNNIRKHAHAEKTIIKLYAEDEAVVLSVEDDGSGFDPAQDMKDRFGLISMRERARLLGGSFDIISDPGQGTHLVVKIPFRKVL